MPEEAPKQLVMDGLFARSTVTYGQSTMLIEYRIKPQTYFGLIGTSILILWLSFLARDVACLLIGFVVVGALLVGIIFDRSYRYEIDKERREIKCTWRNYLGIFTGKTNEKTYPFIDIAFIHIQKTSYRGFDSFRLKLVLQFGKELDLPSGHSLAKCMEYATFYKDFLEIRAPIKLLE